MPEACFLCLDSSEYMRNGDQFPTRLLAVQDAACLLITMKLQSNAENSIGFLTSGGAACTMHETLTSNEESVLGSMSSIPISGKTCHFGPALLIASLALSHRTNPRAEKRIVAFVGSPITETEAELEALAKKLRKDDVAVDVVAFGVEQNVSLLESFVEKVNKKNNSRFLNIARGEVLTDRLISHPIMQGDMPDMMGGGGDAGGGFGVDPNMDPDLALALRLSMEDEEQRRAAAAAAASGGAAPESTPAPAPPVTSAEADYDNMTEEEMIQRAIALSMQESANPPAPNATASSPKNEEEEDEDNFAKAVEEAQEANKKKDKEDE